MNFFFYRKEVTKPRNKTKEFFFNLIFFLMLPLLLLFKLFKWILKCCCRKKPATKEETDAKKDDESEDERQGPEVDIFKEGDILKDGSSGSPSSRGSSKGNIAGVKRSHSTDSSRSSLVIKKSKHESEDEIAVTENRRASTSRRVSDYRKASVQKTEPSVRSLTMINKKKW